MPRLIDYINNYYHYNVVELGYDFNLLFGNEVIGIVQDNDNVLVIDRLGKKKSILVKNSYTITELNRILFTINEVKDSLINYVKVNKVTISNLGKEVILAESRSEDLAPHLASLYLYVKRKLN